MRYGIRWFKCKLKPPKNWKTVSLFQFGGETVQNIRYAPKNVRYVTLLRKSCTLFPPIPVIYILGSICLLPCDRFEETQTMQDSHLFVIHVDEEFVICCYVTHLHCQVVFLETCHFQMKMYWLFTFNPFV